MPNTAASRPTHSVKTFAGQSYAQFHLEPLSGPSHPDSTSHGYLIADKPVLFSEWRAEVIDLDDIHIADALRTDTDEISSDQQLAQTLHRPRAAAWQDLGLEELYEPPARQHS